MTRDDDGKSLPVLTMQQWVALQDGLCPICAAPLLNGREEPCWECGSGPYGGEIELDLSNAENVRICRPYRPKEETGDDSSYEPDPITQYFHILLGLYTWWGHGWLAGIVVGISYYLLIIAINFLYLFMFAGLNRNWIRTLQRIKWVSFIAATIVIGII